MTTPDQNQQPKPDQPYSDPTWASTSAYPPAGNEQPGYGQVPYGQAPYGQAPYGQAGYAPPGYPQPGYSLPRNGLGTASLVLGIIAVVLCWTVWIGGILAVLAICFGAVGLGRANRGEATNRGSAKAGLILGIVAIALLILLIIVGIGIFASGVTTPMYG